MKRAALFLGILFLLSDFSYSQNILYVNNVLGNDAYDGLSPITAGSPVNGPKRTISNAITTALPGALIYIAATGISYVESPNVNKLVTFIGYSSAGTTANVVIELTAGDMIFNIPSGGAVMFLVLPIAGTGYGFPSAAGFQFKGTATTGFYFLSGSVLQVNTVFQIIFPFRYKR